MKICFKEGLGHPCLYLRAKKVGPLLIERIFIRFEFKSLCNGSFLRSGSIRMESRDQDQIISKAS